MKQKNFRKAVNLVQFVFSAHLLHFRKQVERLSITVLLDVTTQLQKLFHFLASRILHSMASVAAPFTKRTRHGGYCPGDPGGVRRDLPTQRNPSHPQVPQPQSAGKTWPSLSHTGPRRRASRAHTAPSAACAALTSGLTAFPLPGQV